MTVLLRSCGKVFRSGLCSLAVVVLVLEISGCETWNLRGNGFNESDLSESARQSRPEKGDVDYWSWSNKARQIERDLHSQ